jgi:hypothetical protein
MQKVVGSNPISRFFGSPLAERVFAFQGLVGAMADEIFQSLAAPNRPARLALIYASHGAIAAATMTG